MILERQTERPTDAGASTVEFAVLLPVLVLIVFGTIQFGIAFNRAQGLQAAAREGARLASVGASESEIVARVRASQSLFDDQDVDVDVRIAGTKAPDPPCRRAGEVVEVRVEVKPSKRYAVNIPLFGERQIRYASEGLFRCERNGSR